MSNCARYGTIHIDKDKITDFIEKGHADRGVINGGVYVCRKTIFNDINLPKRFSFEEDFLQSYSKKMDFRAFVSDDYFVDIGIPEDYNRAQEELRSIV
jgi:D-glycero-alpha-D-manno-heptose 1-phosphate guanylyltransferase